MPRHDPISRTASSRPCCCRSTRTSRSTRRASARTCATSRRSRVSPPSPSTHIRPKSRRARSTSSDACWRSRRTRSASAFRWSTACGRTAAWKRRASPAWRSRAALRRCWFFRRRRSRSANRRRWRSRISGTSPTRPTCRSSCSNIRWRPARAIRAIRSAHLRRGAERARHQGLVRQRPAARDARARAAEPAAAGQRALHPQRLAVLLAGARLQRAPVRLRQRDRRPAGGAVPRGDRPTTSPRRAASMTASIRSPACSIASRGPTCTTA